MFASCSKATLYFELNSFLLFAADSISISSNSWSTRLISSILLRKFKLALILLRRFSALLDSSRACWRLFCAAVKASSLCLISSCRSAI